MAMAYTTWRAMCGSGRRLGTRLILVTLRAALILAFSTGLFVVGHGSMMERTATWLTAMPMGKIAFFPRWASERRETARGYMENLLAQWKLVHTWVTLGVFLSLMLWETLHPYFRLYRSPSDMGRIKHAVKNIFIAAFNSVMVSTAFFFLWLFGASWAHEQQFGVLNVLGLHGLWHLLGAIILMDFWTYWWHVINHQVPFFWRFHQVHHSDPTMDVTTSFRFHFGEIALSSCIRVLLIPLFGLHLWELVVYELCLFAVVQFHHANVGVPGPVDRFLRVFIPTPAMHKIHHSMEPADFNSNYSSLFSVWDRLFGSFRMHEGVHEIRFGLDGEESVELQKVRSLMLRPFWYR